MFRLRFYYRPSSRKIRIGLIGSVDTESSCLGFASATNLRAIGNHFRGVMKDAIHIEEAAGNVVVEGNTIVANPLGSAIKILDNNIGTGSYIVPTRLAIVGNIIQRLDSLKLNAAIELVNDATGSPPLTRATIADNVISGFSKGIKNGSLSADAVAIRDNTIHDCVRGIETDYADTGIKGNTISDCATGIYLNSGGGLIGKNKFINVTNLASCPNGEVTLAGYERSYPVTSCAGGSAVTNFSIATSDEILRGRIAVTAWNSDGNERTYYADIYWDGSTLTKAEETSFGSGVATLAVADVGGVLSARITNTGAGALDFRVNVDFDGFHTFT